MPIPYFVIREYCRRHGIDYDTLDEDEWLEISDKAEEECYDEKYYDDRDYRPNEKW